MYSQGLGFETWQDLLVVQRLKICLPRQGTQVRPLVKELRSHVPWGS